MTLIKLKHLQESRANNFFSLDLSKGTSSQIKHKIAFMKRLPHQQCIVLTKLNFIDINIFLEPFFQYIDGDCYKEH